MHNFSASSERNKDAILDTLRIEFAHCRSVLEIGSGSGQHAIHFGKRLPNIVWQTSELPANIEKLAANVNEFGTDNVRLPVELDVSEHPWPAGRVHGVFTANTLHIMSWSHVVEFFKGIGQVLEDGGQLCIYGPFSRGGQHTADSNEKFDTYLKLQDPESGVRDLDQIEILATRSGLKLAASHALPANNQLIAWKRHAPL